MNAVVIKMLLDGGHVAEVSAMAAGALTQGAATTDQIRAMLPADIADPVIKDYLASKRKSTRKERPMEEQAARAILTAMWSHAATDYAEGRYAGKVRRYAGDAEPAGLMDAMIRGFKAAGKGSISVRVGKYGGKPVDLVLRCNALQPSRKKAPKAPETAVVHDDAGDLTPEQDRGEE